MPSVCMLKCKLLSEEGYLLAEFKMLNKWGKKRGTMPIHLKRSASYNINHHIYPKLLYQ